MSVTDTSLLAVSKHLARLPEGWRRVRLGELCQLNPRRPADLSPTDGEPVTFVPMQAVDETQGRIAWPEVRPFCDVRKGYTYFAENDVLFAKITPCMQNGKHAIASALLGGFGFGTTEFHVLRPSPEITAEWIHFFIRQPEVLENAKAYFTGAVGQQRVPETYLASLEIPLPPLAEQKRIAAILNEQMAAVERAQAAAEAQLEAANALPAAHFREVFSSSEAQRWPARNLGQMCEIQLGKMLSPASKLGFRTRPYLRNANVQWGRFELTDIATMDFTEDQEAKFALRPGDLLVCEGGEPGRAAVWYGEIPDCLYQKALHRLRPKNDAVHPRFVMYRLWLGAAQREFFESQAKTTIAHLPAIRLQGLTIRVPPLREQERIAATLDERMVLADRARTAIHQELDAINKLPAALLRRAFSGEL